MNQYGPQGDHGQNEQKKGRPTYEYYSYSSGQEKQNSQEEYQWNFAEYENASRQSRRPGKRNRGMRAFALVLGGVFVVGMMAFAGYGLWSLFAENPLANTSSQSVSSSSDLKLYDNPQTTEESSPDGVLSTKQISKNVLPSVVGVVQYQKSRPYVATGQGSGIILDADGYIVTNAHVVADADGVKVVLYNGEEYTAIIVGSDTKSDVAVLKISASNLTPAKLGNSDQLEIGEDVIAIGNPGGLSNSVSKGIVSGLNRTVETNLGASMECIQTDAAINPGNSGGALVNEYGYVVGINSSKIAATDYEGIGFAIPINDAKPIIEDLKSYGEVQGRVRLGVEVRMIDSVLAKLNNIPTGAMVISVEKTSDAYQQGLIAGDIIIRIDGKDITAYEDLSNQISSHQPGDSVTLEVYRTGQNNTSQTIQITVQLMEDSNTSE
ncbi:MAG TPA: trypsin-like peptidase domain-containing protein [Firmicutes bacterium]|nr:trypsin-like peptidase domain-containing protein [Bacillota bacterium]